MPSSSGLPTLMITLTDSGLPQQSTAPIIFLIWAWTFQGIPDSYLALALSHLSPKYVSHLVSVKVYDFITEGKTFLLGAILFCSRLSMLVVNSFSVCCGKLRNRKWSTCFLGLAHSWMARGWEWGVCFVGTLGIVWDLAGTGISWEQGTCCSGPTSIDVVTSEQEYQLGLCTSWILLVLSWGPVGSSIVLYAS